MNEIDRLKKQKEKLEKEVKSKEEKEKLEEEIKGLQSELKNNKKRKEKLDSISKKIGKGFEAFQRFADRHGADVDDIGKLLGEEPKKKKKNEKKA